ncbi:MAG: ATP-binding protein [Pseudomonadota bacterium]
MTIRPLDTGWFKLQSAALEQAVVLLTHTVKPAESVQNSLPELYRIFCDRFGMPDSGEDHIRVSRFADSLTAFAHSRILGDAKPSSDELARFFRMFCAAGADISAEDAEVFLQKIEAQGFRKAMIAGVANAIQSFEAVARSKLGSQSSAQHADCLKEALQGMESGDQTRVALLLNLVLGEQMHAHVKSFGHRLNIWFFNEFVEILSKGIAEIERGIQSGDEALYSSAVSELQKQNDGSVVMIKQVQALSHSLKSGPLRSSFYTNIPGFKSMGDRWDALLVRLTTLAHDFNNMLTVISANIELLGKRTLANKEEICANIDMLKRFDYNYVYSLLYSVNRLLAKHDCEVAINLKVADGLLSLKIPKIFRGALFRIVFELCLNAIKYRDKRKDEPFVRIEARMEKQLLRITVADNGLGIKDVDKVLLTSMREHPDLAPGTGLGFASIMGLAERKGWIVIIDSKKGRGTRAAVEIDTKMWHGEESSGNQIAGGMSGIPHASIYQASFDVHAHGFVGYEPMIHMGFMSLVMPFKLPFKML